MPPNSQSHFLCSDLKDRNRRPWGIKSTARFAVAKNPIGAIVFVHGFGGAAETTWKAFPDLLSTAVDQLAELRKYDLFFWGYDSRRRQAADSAEKLQDFLEALAATPVPDVVNPSLVMNSGRQNTNQYSRFIVCAHSLGAIVSRLALINIGNVDKPPQWLSQLRLLLFAPAHSGAQVLSLASVALAGIQLSLGPLALTGQIAEAGLKAWHKSLNDLEVGCATIRELRAETRRLLKRDSLFFDHHRAFVVHGERDGIIRKNRFVQDHRPIEILRVGHMRVCKPQTRTSPAVRALLRILK